MTVNLYNLTSCEQDFYVKLYLIARRHFTLPLVGAMKGLYWCLLMGWSC